MCTVVFIKTIIVQLCTLWSCFTHFYYNGLDWNKNNTFYL